MSSPDNRSIFAKANEGGTLLAGKASSTKRTAAQRSKTPPSGGAVTTAQEAEQAAVREQPREGARREGARAAESDRGGERRESEGEEARRPGREAARLDRENSQGQRLGRTPVNKAHPPQKKREEHNKRAALEEKARRDKRDQLASLFRGLAGEAQFGGEHSRGETPQRVTVSSEGRGGTLNPPLPTGGPTPATGGMEGGGWTPPAALAATAQQEGVGGGTERPPPPQRLHPAGAPLGGDPDQGGLTQAMGACFSAVHGRMPSQQELWAGVPARPQKGGKGNGRQLGKGGRGKGGGYDPTQIPAELRKPTWEGMLNTGDARGVIPSPWAQGYTGAGGGQPAPNPPPSSGGEGGAKETNTTPPRKGGEGRR